MIVVVHGGTLDELARRALLASPIGQAITALDGRFLFANPAYLRLIGRDEVVGLLPIDIVHPDDLLSLGEGIRRVVHGEIDTFAQDRRLRCADGSFVWVHGTTTILRDEDGSPAYFLSAVTEIGARREAEVQFRSLAEDLPLALYRTDERGRYTYVNPSFRELVDAGPAEIGEMRMLDIVHPDDRTDVLRAAQRSITDGGYHARYRISRADEETRWVSSHAVPTRDESGQVNGFVGCLEDITPLLLAQEETSRLAAIVESTSDLIVILEPDGVVTYLNGAARARLGYSDGEVASLRGSDLFIGAFGERLAQEILPRLTAGQQWSGELTIRTASGELVEVSETLVAETGPDGSVARIAAIGRDITHRKRVEATLTHQATHDSLTGLPNRVLLLEHLELAITRAALTEKSLALLFLDIDRFKWVNDRLGHEAGDELLREVSRRLHSVTRTGDTVARLGGDEFVVLCPGVPDEAEAVSVAHRVRQALEATPLSVAGSEVPITASIGIALSRGGDHPEGLLREADAAMYRAKAQGRSRYELFDDAMRARARRRAELTDQLEGGIERGEIVCWYQPTVDLVTRAVRGVEALARWEHPQRGLLHPSEFIELAEETGLIEPLGRKVLEQAVAQARRWSDQLGPGAPCVHVNLSPRQLAAPGLVDVVATTLGRAGVAAGLLCLEITENALMDDVAAAAEVLRELKAVGVRIAIDDFGTGYSSLSYLRRFPVDVLKVDRSFVDGLGPDPEDSAIVAAIVKLAHTLDLEAIAEGVETEDQLERLRLLGCDGAQGYLFSPPTPAARALDCCASAGRTDQPMHDRPTATAAATAAVTAVTAAAVSGRR